MSKQPVYRRILLKLSGEALQSDGMLGIQPEKLAQVSAEIARVVQLGVQVALVVGAGNFVRGAELLFEAAVSFKDLEFIDFGSGFKVAYKEGDIVTDIQDTGLKISDAFKAFCAWAKFDLIRSSLFISFD